LERISMANCHKNFFTAGDSFHGKILLDKSKRDDLIRSRDNLRKHIRAKFEEKDRPKIKFKIQGSFHNGTTVNPLDDDYDIDDGIYFDPPFEKGERPTPETVHSWVKEAADSYRQVDPAKDKKRCIRVPFKDGYHVDFPIYDLTGEDPNRRPELAIKGEGWVFSDPRAFGDWFEDMVTRKGALLRRVVRYFKAWSDKQGNGNSYKMPGGIVLTILAAEEFQSSDRDDEAFAETASAIYNRLKINQSIKNPVDRSEDLRDRISGPQFDNFMAKLERLVQNAETALEHESEEEAAKYWQKQLGDRFPVYEDQDGKGKSAATHQTAGIVGASSGSA
jgi:hypothetical protein